MFVLLVNILKLKFSVTLSILNTILSTFKSTVTLFIRCTLRYLYQTSVGHLLKSFVQNGADMNKTDFYSLTPLQRATEFGHIDVVEYLLQAGLHSSSFLPRCMQCRRGLAMRILSVCPSVCPSHACIVTKR